jgi:periplasmic divalent cation tolerance protein
VSGEAPFTDVRVILVTCGSEEEAVKVGRALVERKLAACVNIVPGVRSIYRWEGKVHDDREHLLIVKTSLARWKEIAEAVRELHSYACPETIALPVSEGAGRYLAWVEEETSR